jgi:hypothetical protein
VVSKVDEERMRAVLRDLDCQRLSVDRAFAIIRNLLEDNEED